MTAATSRSKPFAWSYSALNQFENCARQYYHTKIAKDFPEIEHDANNWGKQVHKALAARVKHCTPLPTSMARWEDWGEWAREGLGEQEILEVEQQLAITQQIEPCAYFARTVDPWFRTVLDVMRIDGPCARIIDWKTGKNVDENSDQLLLAATVVFAHYPNVQRCQCQFVWLQHGNHTEQAFFRKDLMPFWVRTMPRVERMRHAIRTGEFPCRPSGLCKKHCGVRTCEYFGRGQY